MSDSELKVPFKSVADVLLNDEDGNIRNSGKWPLLIDANGAALTFLRYRNVNYLNALNQNDMQEEKIRMALLGSIRHGKPLVIDMMDADLFNVVTENINKIQPNLMQDLMSRKLLQDENYMSLVKSSDDKMYQSNDFMHQFSANFMFILVTKMASPPPHITGNMLPVRVVMG